MKISFEQSVIEVVEGDITEMKTDAIVNAANEHLAHGGGVAGAIVRKGGRIIQHESRDWISENGIVTTGSAAITSGGNLSAKYVIHAVGPVMGSGDEDAKLQSATLSALRIADKHDIESIAFPAISAGIFGYPIDRCAHVMISSTIEYFKSSTNLKRVVFCLWGNEAFDTFVNELKRLST